MHLIDGFLVFSPTDLHHFLECEYLTRLEIEVANGRVLEQRRSPEADLLASKGEAHERAYLSKLHEEGKTVVDIHDAGRRTDWSTAAQCTRDAIRSGADTVYQAVFLSDGWRGRADFLIRVDRPSALGGWSYEVLDTKLARHAKPSHVLQLAYYTEQLTRMQDLQPDWMHLVLGTGEHARFSPRDYLAYFRSVRGRFLRAIESVPAESAYPVVHCALCGYAQHCEDWWEAEDHLTLVAGIRRSQVDRLRDAGVRTTTELAAVGSLSIGIGERALDRLRHQAALQTHFRINGTHRYDLLPSGEENGFRLLPSPSPGDVFFDMEGFPFFEPAGGLEYLFGAVIAESGDPNYRAFRGNDRASEKRAFEQFIDFVWDRLRRWSDLHVYHYSHYEPSALKRLAALHATREEELDELLRRDAFVDLYQVVRRSIRISHDNYSIKAVREFFMPDAGQGAVTGGAQSIVEFQRWLDTGDAAILYAIERYNEEDCVSTLALRNWLLERREDAQRQFDVDIPFLALPERRNEPVVIEPDEHADLRSRLAAIGEAWTVTLGHLLDYHRREAKPEWWAYFQRRKKSLDELVDDTEAIAYLTPTTNQPVVKKQSLIHTLDFPPQEFKLKADTKVEGPLGEGPAGTIEWIDAARGCLGLRRSKSWRDNRLPTAVIAGGPVPDQVLRSAVARVAQSVASFVPGSNNGAAEYRAVVDILRCEPPRFHSSVDIIQTLDLAAQIELVSDLDKSYLFIQGPPGSGKTWTGARLIVALLERGHRVGVTAPSHRAIHNLLEEVERVAIARHVPFTGLKKRSTSDETAFVGRFITSTTSNDECESATAQLVAGTAWLFARKGMDQSVDYLFVDEAGQVSLADALAVGTAAHNIVLLGDPQQLPHVTQNSHPEGVGLSVLEHLLDGAATVAEDRGLFLANSWRMHPDICRFVSEHSYEGRLSYAPGCELQDVVASGLNGAGLRYVAVDHRHNAQQSPEEADAVAQEIRLLLENGTVIDRKGQPRPLEATDILVVAPYNMQVRCLRDALPEDVEVGTVDKFQGREAAIVFFSMASSTGDDVPRGLEFLFNQNRFNVAISRAQCLSVVVCSPRLLETRCRSVDQMRLVNTLCHFVEQTNIEAVGQVA